MREREIQIVTDRWIATDQPSDNPVTAVDITQQMSPAAPNDRIVYVVVNEVQPETDLIEKEEPRQATRQIISAAAFLRDFEVLLLVLYAAYALVVVGAIAFVLLQWGHLL